MMDEIRAELKRKGWAKMELGDETLVLRRLRHHGVPSYALVVYEKNGECMVCRVLGRSRHGYRLRQEGSGRRFGGVHTSDMLGRIVTRIDADGNHRDVSALRNFLVGVPLSLWTSVQRVCGDVFYGLGRMKRKASKRGGDVSNGLRTMRKRMSRDVRLFGLSLNNLDSDMQRYRASKRRSGFKGVRWDDVKQALLPKVSRNKPTKPLPKELTMSHRLKKQMAVRIDLPTSFSLRTFCLVMYTILSLKIMMSFGWLGYFFVYATAGSSTVYVSNALFTLTWLPLILFFVAYYYHLNKVFFMSTEKITMISGVICLIRTGMFGYRFVTSFDANLVTLFNAFDMVVWVCLTCFFFGLYYKMTGEEVFGAAMWKNMFKRRKKKRPHQATKEELRAFEGGSDVDDVSHTE